MMIVYLFKRLLAQAIDIAVLLIGVLAIASVKIEGLSDQSQFLDFAISTTCLILIWILAHTLLNALLTSRLGASVGKAITQLDVTKETTGKHLTLKRALFRSTVGFSLSSSLMGLGYIWILVDRSKRSWADLASQSVVRQRQNNAMGIVLGTVALFISLVASGVLMYEIGSSVSQKSDILVVPSVEDVDINRNLPTDEPDLDMS